MGEFLALLAALFYGVGGLLVRSGSESIPPYRGLRLSIAASAVTAVVLAAAELVRAPGPPWSLKGIALFALGGVAGTFVGRWANIGSVVRLGPSRASLYKNTQPLYTTLLGLLVLGEAYSAQSLAGGAMLLGGVAAATPRRFRRDPESARRRWSIQPEQRLTGIVMGLGGAAVFATGSVLRKVAVGVWSEPVLGAAVGALAAAAAALLSRTPPEQVDPRATGARRGATLFFLHGVVAVLAAISFIASLRLTEVWVAQLLLSTEPLMTVALSWLLFRGHEPVDARLLAAVTTVGFGAWLLIGGR